MTVTLSGAVPPAGQYNGAITVQATGVSLRLPYMFVVGDGVASNLVYRLILGTRVRDRM